MVQILSEAQPIILPKLVQSWQLWGTRFSPIFIVLSFARPLKLPSSVSQILPSILSLIHTHYRHTKTLALPGLGHRSLEFCPATDPDAGDYSLRRQRLGSQPSESRPIHLPQGAQTDITPNELARSFYDHIRPSKTTRSSHIPMPNPMAQYATLSFRISGAKDETHLSDNLFRVTQTQSDILGCCSGNKGDNNTYDSYNNKFEFVLPSTTDFVVRNQGGVFGAGEAGIIRIPERCPAKN